MCIFESCLESNQSFSNHVLQIKSSQKKKKWNFWNFFGLHRWIWKKMSLVDETNAINNYLSLTVFPIGILLNAFSLYIFSRPRLNKTNMGILNRWQLVIDIFLLAASAFVYRHHTILFPTSFYLYSSTTCGLLTFMRRFTLHSSSWMTTFIAFDRFLYVHVSRNLKFMKSRIKLCLILVAMFILVAIVDIENAFFYLTIAEAVKNMTDFSTNQTRQVSSVSKTCTASPEVSIASDIVSICLRTYFPTLIMVILDTYMIVDLRRSKKRLSGSIRSKKETQFTFTVILSNILFFLFNSPLSVAYFVGYGLRGTGQPNKVIEIYNFVFGLTLNIALLHQSLEFFIIVSINKLFRKELRKVFKSFKATRFVRFSLVYRSTVKIWVHF